MAWTWDDRHRYLVWLKVEMAVCEELAETGVISKGDWSELQKRVKALFKKGGVDPKIVEKHEAVTRHDVIAFTTAVAEEIGPISRHIHFGLTSSDVVDTALSLMIQESGRILLEGVDKLLKVLLKQAEKYRNVPTIGRSHGIFAEPTSFGLKFLGWYCEWLRNRERLVTALVGLRVGKLSGAVGVNPHWGPEFEARVLKRLGLAREEVSTQIVPRDRHAEFLSTLAILGTSLERIAVELRHLQRSEVAEVMEGFQKGQKGSSAMPHKRNPISSENISGCARLLRSYAQASLENVALWHERDISHSSVERVVFPDATTLLDYALRRMSSVLDQLVVKTDRIQQNLKSAGSTVFSGHYLLELVKAGVTREQAYVWVQQCALESFEKKEDFVELLVRHDEIKKRLTEKKIRQLGSLPYQLRHVDEIYRKALKSKGK
jgi:adenylosuccinate lyase